MSQEQPASYKATLNLPATDFPMKADLVKSEPSRLAKWQSSNLYARLMEARRDATPFILHDGPPFANGDIHIGHVVNKTLKDIVLRYKSMAGFKCPYVPGWDCHGLPIEHKIQEQIGPTWRDMPVADIRKQCFEYAQSYVEKQAGQFQRVGVLGDWSNPYRTMAPAYEASTLEIFARIVERGLVYRQLKPVNWSIENQTALAEADLEYKDVVDTSVYVAFTSANPGALKAKLDLRLRAEVKFLIWTTTPWTLPANLAIAAGPDVDYALLHVEDQGNSTVLILAADLVEKVLAKRPSPTRRTNLLKTVKGHDLEGLEYAHPFIDRIGKVVLADYVTTTDGTGLVHTAPGHGDEDYQTGRRYGLDVYCPVLANGRFDSTAPNFLTGLTVWQANPVIIEKLRETSSLFADEKYPHSYPHDARSKKPTIYRATQQWFVSVDKPFVANPSESTDDSSIRTRALKAIDSDITFHPDWGRARLRGMLESRPDWVLSRQRAWGLPMPVFYSADDRPLLDASAIRAVARHFARVGSDAWFNLSVDELLQGVTLPDGFDRKTLRKGTETFDVWFESGNSWFGVVEQRSDQLGHVPVDLYLEGSDQHRGWFQLSMLPSLAVNGHAPFRAVLTHGFIVKPDGTKVSKSDKEYVTAMQEVDRHGADLLRLYVASLDYQGDMPASPQLISAFGDKYRKIRNTIRYLLSNIDDFDPASPVSIPAPSLDDWMLGQLAALVRDVVAAYDTYKFHIAFKLLHDFCNVQISSVYGNAMKDRLYCDSPTSPLRRRAQSVMHKCVVALIKLLAPMCVFTADEAWEHLKRKPKDEAHLDCVHLTHLPPAIDHSSSHDATYAELMRLRDEALLQLDRLKKDVGLNKALDAEIVYQLPPAWIEKLSPMGVDLEDIVGAGHHRIERTSGDSPAVVVIDRRADTPACARSWKRRPDVGSDPRFPDLSARDARAVSEARQKGIA
jgi:isoleucyl-tRNA synthetase